MTYVNPAAGARAYQRTQPPLAVPASEVGVDGVDGAVVAAMSKLPVQGQGTVGLTISRSVPITVTATGQPGAPSFRWTIDHFTARLDLLSVDGGETQLLEVGGVGLDASLDCPYWFSFDCHNRLVRYGKGEMRLGTMLASCQLPLPPEDRKKDDPWAWMSGIQDVELSGALTGFVDLWKDPVTIELPLRIVPHDVITMEEMAYGRVTVPASLTQTGQKLYDNVAGKSFLLDTPDFPDFSAAIKASILDKDNGWCAQILKKKADEFGDDNPDMTYLRITLGTNQGESPGIPFVMEIWPSGNYSPIHNHGGSDAVIRVLHGEITVSLFAFLAPEETNPFAVKTFVKEDVTWISPRLNQVHQLKNNNMDEPCITIQCYLYSEGNDEHHPFFDYLGQDDIEHFDPNSDADFLTFKRKMQEEWARR
ncbi:MAG TPA: cysteine dioxygenase family protein [Allosphingosinicella sp.]|jgi:predicted metal-dependent enzyme (double-stranded beta helix superfamily)